MDFRKSARTSKEMKEGVGTEGGQGAGSTMDLAEFLAEAELSHYLTALRNELKVTCVEHLKYVKEEDLEGIGMTRPEMRRLKKFYKKEHPQGTFGKLKKAILRTGGGEGGRSGSPPPSEHRVSRPVSVLRPAGRIVIPVDSVALSKTVGEGHFGTVCQAVWTAENGEKVPVAVKCVRKEKVQRGSEEVLREVTVLQTVDHDNMVRLYGVVSLADSGLLLVSELAPMRSLMDSLKEGSSHVEFSVPRLCDFAQQVCDGMSYLESKHLVHGDLAARNVLLFSKSKVKISDVGVSGALGAGREFYLGQTRAAWCAPECFQDVELNWASDVWAFGVTLWELFTYGAQPWAGLTAQQIMQAVEEPESQRLEQPDLCPKEYYSLMLKCWQHEPESRPTFSQLFLTLPQIRPVQVKAVKDASTSPTADRDQLQYSNYDIIIVLDKSPRNAGSPGLWKGCVSNGQSGFFNPVHTVPYVEPKTSPISLPKTSLSRKESGRSSKRSKLRADMIGAPQNDLRHTGHIGYDGAVFGDVSFIGDNYDKLPVKVGTSGKVDVSRGSSLSSIPRTTESPDRNGFVKTSTSDDCLDRRNVYGHSWISQESLASTQAEEHSEAYLDIEDNSIFADFKMPDLTSSFDLGPSFMDEVLKALDEKEKQAEAATSSSANGCDFGDGVDANRVHLEDRTPLAEENTAFFDEKGFTQTPTPQKQRASPPPLPAHPPRLDMAREKKQAKVKPMSASEEKMMEDAITLANEVTATRAQRHSQSQSPPQSPTTSEKAALDFPESVMDPAPSLICKLKNSIRRSPKTERKRTFSDDRPPKGDVEEDIPPGAQEAYNALVVRGSEKLGDQQSQAREERLSVSSDAVFTTEAVDSNTADARVSVGTPQTHLSSSKSSGMPQPPPRPMPKPRLDPKKSDLPVPKPRPEIIQRVEPIRRPPDSPEVPLKEKESQIPVPATRKQSWSESKEREREQLKKTIEIVRVESPAKDEVFSAGPDADTKESTPEPDSDSTRPSSASEGGESSTKVMSLFEDDFNEPSPREIMSKLARESRMRRNMDHQRVLSGENQDSQAVSMTRARREPSGIPGKMTTSHAEEGDKEEEVDTNPLRMLRGGAIPIRTSRGAGNSPSNSLGSAFHYPKLGLHSAGDREGGEERGPAPHLPPRARSISTDLGAGMPSSGGEAAPTVPPRTPLRQHSMPALNTRPRERRHPLVYRTSECETSAVPPPLSGNDTDPSIPPPTTGSYSASYDASCSLPSPCPQLLLPSVSLHDEPCPLDLPPAPARPRPHPLTLAVQNNMVPNTGASLSLRSHLASHHYYGVDESCLDTAKPSLVVSSRRPLPHPPPSPDSPPAASCFSGSGGRKFAPDSIQCSLEQLGFYNQHDPFWGQTVLLPDRTPALDSTASSEEVSPLLLVNYKNSDNVSYEDLLDFGLDRQKNGEEVETLLKILDNEVSYEECRTALEETQGDLGQAVKYIRLKQLLSLHLSDVHTCKRALMSKSWDVHRAADHLLSLQRPSHTHTASSPESLEV